MSKGEQLDPDDDFVRQGKTAGRYDRYMAGVSFPGDENATPVAPSQSVLQSVSVSKSVSDLF